MHLHAKPGAEAEPTRVIESTGPSTTKSKGGAGFATSELAPNRGMETVRFTHLFTERDEPLTGTVIRVRYVKEKT
jgi:hypothetical protein